MKIVVAKFKNKNEKFGWKWHLVNGSRRIAESTHLFSDEGSCLQSAVRVGDKIPSLGNLLPVEISEKTFDKEMEIFL